MIYRSPAAEAASSQDRRRVSRQIRSELGSCSDPMVKFLADVVAHGWATSDDSVLKDLGPGIEIAVQAVMAATRSSEPKDLDDLTRMLRVIAAREKNNEIVNSFDLLFNNRVHE